MTKPDLATENCSTCYYGLPTVFTRIVDGHVTGYTGIGCRNRPPSQYLNPVSQVPVVSWPECLPSDWCAEFSTDGKPRNVGAAGASGSIWRYGTAAPSGGTDGDWYVKITAYPGTANVYTNVNGVWVFVYKVDGSGY